jgi:hypothetical protein
MNKLGKRDLLIAVIVVLSLAAIRIFSPFENFSPIGALALMGGMLIGRKALAFIIPFAALLIGDLIFSLNSSMYADYLFSSTFIAVYLAFAVIIALGMILKPKISLLSVVGGSILAAIGFFLITNAGSWIALEYPKNLTGLMASYEAGIPFFRNTLVSQLAFSLFAYFAYCLARFKKPVLA